MVMRRCRVLVLLSVCILFPAVALPVGKPYAAKASIGKQDVRQFDTGKQDRTLRFRQAASGQPRGYAALCSLAEEAAGLGEYGWAVLFWQRALLLHDGDAALFRNIAIARARTGADRMESGVPALIRVILFFYFSFSRYELYGLIAVLVVLFFVFLNVLVFLRRTSGRLFRGGAAALALILVLLAVSLAVKHGQYNDPTRGIILVQNTPFRQHQDSASTLLLQLPAALSVSILETRDDSLRISLPGGGQGWVPGNSVGTVVSR